MKRNREIDDDKQHAEWLAKERTRVAAQRNLWAALPDLGPSFLAVDALKKAMLDRAWQLLDAGAPEASDALLEFLPEEDADALQAEFFKD